MSPSSLGKLLAAVGGGMKEAIRRGNAYADAGEDLIFFESPFSEAEVEHAARDIHAIEVCANNGK